jgi:hypothetical protein
VKTLCRLALVIGGVMVCSAVARAEKLPSFRLESSAWDATHIVEVTQEAKRDGVFTVVASWKGSLKRGDVLKFPALGDFSMEESRTIFVFPGEKVPPGRVPHVSGLRMVLFLTNADKGPAVQGRPKAWRESVADVIKTSVAWIDGGEVFAFVQVMNPGAQVVWPLGLTEQRFKDRVMHVAQTSDRLRQALAEDDPARRAQRLSVLACSDVSLCQGEALDGLGRCGAKGVPVVVELLRDNPSAGLSYGLIRALGKIGGAAAGKELVALLQEEFAFWLRRGPKLNKDWWHDWSLGQQEVYALRDRSVRFHAAIAALAEANYPECRPLVRAVRGLLTTHPQLLTGGGDALDRCRTILGEK